ncbi:MAG: hypothetical protein ACEY3J_00375 [Arsenophonus sp.]
MKKLLFAKYRLDALLRVNILVNAVCPLNMLVETAIHLLERRINETIHYIRQVEYC